MDFFGCWFWTGRHAFLLNLLLMCFCSALADGTFNGPSWLRQYGYMAPLGSTDSSNEDLPAAIREMQKVYNLEVTGVLDQQTILAMKRPRCGIPDKTNVGWSSYVAVGTKWDKHDLTYSIESFATKIAWKDTSKVIHNAFKVWKDVSQLTFEYIPYEHIHNGLRDADIMISFYAGPHKGHEFISSDLAHASSPMPGRTGYVHFNSDRQWSVTNQQVQGVYNMFLVAVHELGHSLGLGHSDNTSSIMHKDYKWRDTDDFQLPAEDRQGIQDLYGYVPKPNYDALTLENAQLKKEIIQHKQDKSNMNIELTQHKKEKSNMNTEITQHKKEITRLTEENSRMTEENSRMTEENSRMTEENSRQTAHIANLMRQKTPTPCPPPVKTCPGGWTPFGGRCYYTATDEYRTWQGARDYCQRQGADLVVINSPEEQAFIRGLAEGDWSWIGLSRSGGTWTWLDGTPLTTTYWASGYPDNDEDYNCALYHHRANPGAWDNYSCSWTRSTMCEK